MLLVASRVRMIPGIRLSTDTDYLWNTSTINIVLLLLLLLLFFFFINGEGRMYQQVTNKTDESQTSSSGL